MSKNIYKSHINAILDEIYAEIMVALKFHGDFKSLHEAYAVILEEVDELWEEIKLKKELRDSNRMREEAIQIAAMCIKLIKYLDDGKR